MRFADIPAEIFAKFITEKYHAETFLLRATFGKKIRR